MNSFCQFHQYLQETGMSISRLLHFHLIYYQQTHKVQITNFLTLCRQYSEPVGFIW